MMAGGVLWQAAVFARSTRLECAAGEARECVMVREYGPYESRRIFLVRNVTSITIVTHSGKSTNYGVSVRLRDGTAFPVMRPAGRVAAQTVHTNVSRAVATAASATSVSIEEPSIFSAALFAMMSLAFLFLAAMLNAKARLQLDFTRKTIDYTRMRWPFKSITRRLQAADVERACVATRIGSKGRTVYELALAIRGEGDLILVTGGGASEKRTKAAAAELNALLSKLRDE